MSTIESTAIYNLSREIELIITVKFYPFSTYRYYEEGGVSKSSRESVNQP